jgi:hypothetical protein
LHNSAAIPDGVVSAGNDQVVAGFEVIPLRAARTWKRHRYKIAPACQTGGDETKKWDAPMLGFFGRRPSKPEISPRLTGEWLASKLDERCTITNLTDDQRGLAEQINLPLNKLLDDIVILSAFSIDFASLSLLHGNAHQKVPRCLA